MTITDQQPHVTNRGRRPHVTISAIVLSVAAALPGGAHADYTATWHAYCEELSLTASLVMESHQYGIPMRETLAVMGDDTMMREMVLQAYETPRYSTRSNREAAAAEFRDSIHVMCLRAD